jgi:short-subunit dehydrogenase
MVHDHSVTLSMMNESAEHDQGKRWAIVTGASSGIGLAFARELSLRGHSVLALARRRERLEALAKETGRGRGHVEPLVADLLTEQGLASVIQRIASLNNIALLINNAGIATGGNFLSAPVDGAIKASRLNIDAVVRLTHEVLRVMIPKGRGAVINVASVVAFQPFPHFAVYAASKAFVLSFTEAVAEEVKNTGVRVMALCPGAARTEMEMFSHNEGLLGKLPSLTPEQVVKSALRALDNSRVVKIVGLFNALLVFMNRFMPRAAVRWMMGTVAQPPAG